MKKILICISILCLLSCSNKNYQNLNKGDWKSAFKNQVFINSLKYLYGKDFNKILLEQDMSGSNNFENLHGEYYTIFADSLAKRFSHDINSLPKGYLIEGKRTILNYCLEFYTSRKLNSIADSLYNNRKRLD